MNPQIIAALAAAAEAEGLGHNEEAWQLVCWLYDYNLVRQKSVKVFAIQKLYPTLEGSRAERMRQLAERFDIFESEVEYAIRKVAPRKRTTLSKKTV
jgi:hypothetical protein